VLIIDIIAILLVIAASMVSIISTCMYRAAKKLQSEDRRKVFFFRLYLVSVGMIAFSIVCNWLLGPSRMEENGYILMAFLVFIIFIIGFGLTACTTFAFIAHKIVGLKSRRND